MKLHPKYKLIGLGLLTMIAGGALFGSAVTASEATIKEQLKILFGATAFGIGFCGVCAGAEWDRMFPKEPTLEEWLEARRR